MIMGTCMEYTWNDSKTAFFVLANKYGKQLLYWVLRENILAIASSKAQIPLQIINFQYLEAELFSGHFSTETTLPTHTYKLTQGKINLVFSF